MALTEYQGPYNPYKHNQHIGTIIFTQIDNTQSTAKSDALTLFFKIQTNLFNKKRRERSHISTAICFNAAFHHTNVGVLNGKSCSLLYESCFSPRLAGLGKLPGFLSTTEQWTGVEKTLSLIFLKFLWFISSYQISDLCYVPQLNIKKYISITWSNRN